VPAPPAAAPAEAPDDARVGGVAPGGGQVVREEVLRPRLVDAFFEEVGVLLVADGAGHAPEHLVAVDRRLTLVPEPDRLEAAGFPLPRSLEPLADVLVNAHGCPSQILSPAQKRCLYTNYLIYKHRFWTNRTTYYNSTKWRFLSNLGGYGEGGRRSASEVCFFSCFG